MVAPMKAIRVARSDRLFCCFGPVSRLRADNQMTLIVRIKSGLSNGMESALAWVPWLNIGLIILLPVVLFVFKNWIVARITKVSQHDFDVKLKTIPPL